MLQLLLASSVHSAANKRKLGRHCSASLHAGCAWSDNYACCDRCGGWPPEHIDRCASGFTGMAARHIDVRSGAPICCLCAILQYPFACAACGAQCDSCEMMRSYACTCTCTTACATAVIPLCTRDPTLQSVTATQSCHRHLPLSAGLTKNYSLAAVPLETCILLQRRLAEARRAICAGAGCK